MIRRHRVGWLSALAILLLPALAVAEPTVAVIDLEARGGLSANEALVISDRVREHLLHTGKFEVIERGKMQEITEEQGLQQSGACATDECIAEIGMMLGAERMVAGAIGKVGRIYSISLRLLDVETGKIVNTVSDDCTCPIEEVLTTATQRVVAGLVGVAAPGEPGARPLTLQPAKKGGSKTWLWTLLGIVVAGGAAAAVLGGGGGDGSPGTVSVSIPDPFGGS